MGVDSQLVIARYSTAKASIFVAAWITACGLVFAATLYHPPGVGLKEYLDSKGLFRFDMALICWVALLMLVIRQLAIINQLILRNGNALWLSHDRLFYLDIYSWNILFVSVDHNRIASISVGSLGLLRPRGITLKLRDGRAISILAWILSEPPDVIATRLQGVLSVDVDQGPN